MQLFTRLFWITLVVAAIHASIGLGMAVVGNPEGWVGGLLYALLYAMPLLMIALALRSSQRSWWRGAGWAALVLAAYYALVAFGNWSGYSDVQAIFVVAITVPTVALDLGIFWGTVLHTPNYRHLGHS